MSYTIVDATQPATERPTGLARIIALGVALVTVAAGIATERLVTNSGAADGDRRVVVANQMNSSTSAGSLWFCPLVGDTTAGPGTVLVSRSATSSRAATVSLTIHSPSGKLAESTQQLTTSSAAIAVLDLLPGAKAEDLPSLAATIEVDEPSAAVSVQVPGDDSPLACSSVVGSEWWLGDGTTVLGSSTSLALYNPFPESALVDLEFLTERGPARPTDLQGLAVAPGSLRIIDLTDQVRRRVTIASKAVARSGRIVLGQRMTRGKAASVSLGSPTLTDAWFFPNASFAANRAETYVFVNPSSNEMTVALSAILESGDVEPFSVSIPPDGIATFDSNEDQRIPEGAPYALVATSESRFLATRTVRTPKGGKGSLLMSSPGAGRTSNRWVVDAITTAEDRSISILNPFDVGTKVTIAVVGQPAGSGSQAIAPITVTVGAGRRTRVDLAPLVKAGSSGTNDAAGALTVVVSSTDADVVVERGRASASNATLAFPSGDS